ncbi:SgcJ/EcaC family oxidoreductase [Paenibacillus tyrfis]|uniref:SgcJ/EcaC family oxidoreductase n=1 Tax=Paenibacillus tyrfis TaxID=1501230 RepID=UPI0020A09793|nr:SgcJ/EcaC family oxidoreductase [Paenibacillus tyrfis]MCP1310083.1 SgcJ/EcaC family oxidoreductase [Paenibacillus tyrfis]
MIERTELEMEYQQRDMQAMQELFTALSDAWNRGDGAAFGECFTEDADYVTFMGQHLKGRKQIAEVHQWLFNGPLKGSTLESSAAAELRPRFVTPEVAIVHGIGEAKLADPAQDSTDRGSINTNVVVNQNGVWKITAFHNCRIQEIPGGRG